MNSTIIGISKEFDQSTCKHYWIASIEFDEEPDLKLGKVELIQKK